MPAVSTPAHAAPQMQVACGLMMAQWTFDSLATGGNPSPNNSFLASDVASATASTGSGLTSPTISNTSSHSSPNSWYSSGFATGTSLNTGNNDYFEFVIDTTNYSGVNVSFYAIRSNQGPSMMQVYYSTDGITFNALAGTYSIGTTYPASSFIADLTGLTNIAGTTYIRIYGWNAGGGGGTGRIDDVNFTGCKPATPTPTATNTGTATSTGTPTNTATNTVTSTNTSTATNTGTATSTSSVSTTGIVISEFRTRGANGANDEFIELYNPSTTAVDISGWKINASNDQGTTGTRATIPASTLLRSGQYYLVANTSTNGYSGAVSANLTYGTGITDAGGIALVRSNNTIVDQVGMGSASAYKEGATLAPLAGTTDQSYERKLGGASDSCQDTNDNSADFQLINPSSPHNYASPLSLCGVPGPTTLITTTTTITSDNPDPSVVNGNVVVSVTVSVPSGKQAATGTVNITGANINCSLTLSAGKGSCTVKFTSTGSKGLAATYLGDNTHAGSSGSTSHLVTTTTAIKTPTRVPTPLPPPPLVAINEFVPRPGHDWNNDGVINVGDEYIELLNHGVVDVNLSGYSLDDEVNIGSTPYRLPAITLKPGERHVFYGSETGLLLSDGGDGVRLLKPNGQLVDAYNYSVVRFPDQSYCRLPDNGGLDDWNQNCFPTPGLQNSLSGSSVNPPTENGAENLCPIADTLPNAFLLAECLPFGNNIWNPAYWDKFGWFDERYLPESPGKWPVFAD